MSHLTESLLKSCLFRHREAADRLPARAQLLHLNFDPGRVIVAALSKFTGRALHSLHAASPFAQLFLEHLQYTWRNTINRSTF